MIEKIKAFLEQQYQLAVESGNQPNVEIYQKKLEELSDMQAIQEQGLDRDFAQVNDVLQKRLYDLVEQTDVPCFKDMCTFREFLSWFNDMFPETLSKNVLYLMNGDSKVSYINLHIGVLDAIVMIEPVYSTINLMDKNTNEYLGSLFLEDMDLYHMCICSTSEYEQAMIKDYEAFQGDY